MPIYNCKALTPQGQIVKSRVEDTSRLACIRKLKRNGLTPISVSQTLSVGSIGKKANSKMRKNIKPEANLSSKNKKTKSKNRKASGRYMGKIKLRYWWWRKENNLQGFENFYSEFLLIEKG